MTVIQPDTFVLTAAEAAAIQSAQMLRQASIARGNPILKYGSIAVPFLIIGAIFVVDLVWYGGAMPMSLFVTLMAVFVAGMMTQTAGYWLSLMVSKRRIIEQTRQVFAPRTVRLTDAGIEQATPDVKTVHAWSGIDRAEQTGDLIAVWAGHLLSVVVPMRAFPSERDALAFLEACRQCASSGKPDRQSRAAHCNRL